jgi:hypothetical protein
MMKRDLRRSSPMPYARSFDNSGRVCSRSEKTSIVDPHLWKNLLLIGMLVIAFDWTGCGKAVSTGEEDAEQGNKEVAIQEREALPDGKVRGTDYVPRENLLREYIWKEDDQSEAVTCVTLVRPDGQPGYLLTEITGEIQGNYFDYVLEESYIMSYYNGGENGFIYLPAEFEKGVSWEDAAGPCEVTDTYVTLTVRESVYENCIIVNSLDARGNQQKIVSVYAPGLGVVGQWFEMDGPEKLFFEMKEAKPLPQTEMNKYSALLESE